jgi:N-acyl-D-amino-acid deacylase
MIERYDLVLRGGRVIDGTGRAAFEADVAIRGERIEAVGAVPKGAGAAEIEIAGKAVAPGFIDVHTHDDRALLAAPDMAMKASQGVTTVVVGNCGVSLAPLTLDGVPPPPLDLLGDRDAFRYARFADYLAALDAVPPALNAACLVGHSTLRVGCMAALDRPATPAETEAMRGRLREALDAGAIGMSSGLFYAPANPAPREELTALAETLKPAGAVYTTHMRDESDHVLDSLDETFATARDAGVPVVISHHKVVGKRNFGRTSETLPRIAAAMEEQPVALDAYPYIASSTVLREQMIPLALKILITWSKSHPAEAGRTLADIAADWGVGQEAAAARLQPAGAIYWTMDEADVRRVLGFPHTMIGSDGLPHDAHPHPRLWGSFPRVLGHYSRDVGLFPIEEAVRRMTGLPAANFRLAGRGRLAPGRFADITVFDPATVADRATFEHPMIPAAGIELVLVNGQAVWRDGAATGARPGRALRRQALQAEARALDPAG